MVRLLASIAVDRGFELPSGQTNDYKIGICWKCRFLIVAEKKIMLSPVRKKNIALLNLSSQCIVFTEKCIFVPHEKKTIVH
jgi:hypothetical protein